MLNGATVAMHYVYNGMGERVRKYLNTANTYTLYDDAGRWIGDYGNTGTPNQQVIWFDDLPVGVLDGAGANQKLHYIEPDALGTPRVVIDRTRGAQGVAIWTWNLTGEAFGTSTPNENPDGDATAFVFDMRFPGQRYDAASGLNYNYFRDYEPGMGRYSQSDPIGLNGGVNTYGYVRGNPISHIDPLGLVDIALELYAAGVTNRMPDRRGPFFFHASLGIYVATIGITHTKNGTLFLGYGVAHGSPKSLVSGKIGGSAAAGYMLGCQKTGDEVDNYVTGATTGGSAYYGLGGGYGKNAAGSAVEVGVGTPGATLQPFEYMIPIWNTGLKW